MKWAVISIVLLLSGCLSTPEQQRGNDTATTATVKEKADEAAADPAQFSAREGLKPAESGISKVAEDAVLVSVSGTADASGKSAQWEYTFDSLKKSKSYVYMSPEGLVRDRPYSFREVLEGSFVDSDKVASSCKAESGEFSLEVQDGKPVWTVISDGKPCTVDAVKGALLGGDE